MTANFNLYANKSKLSYPDDLEKCPFEELAEAILPNNNGHALIQLKSLNATKVDRDNLSLGKQFGFSITCIDDGQALNKQSSVPIDDPQKIQILAATSLIREKKMADALFRLHAEGKGVIIPLGYKHWKPMVERLKQKGMRDQDMVCHFVHSTYQASNRIDEIKSVHDSGEIFSDKTSCATTSDEIEKLANKLLTEVKSKITRNCHIQFLSDFFKVKFKPSIRPEYHLDARLPIKEMKGNIQNDLDDLGIQHYTDKQYFVIPNVNTTEVASDIRLLPFKT